MTTQMKLGAEEIALLQEFGIGQTSLLHFDKTIVMTKVAHRNLSHALGETEYKMLRLLMLRHDPTEHHPVPHQGAVIHEITYPLHRKSEKKRNVVVHYARYHRGEGSLRLVLVLNVMVTTDGPPGIMSEKSKMHHLIDVLREMAGQVPPDFFT
jgi:hypothetical protein